MNTADKNIFPTENIFNINNTNFEDIALQIFQFQYNNNALYRDFCNSLHKNINNVMELTDIPFLPISFFKTHRIQTTNFTEEKTFESSGTTGSINSKHFVKDIGLYERSFIQHFTSFYGAAENYCILGLLPSYLERGNSSLVYMVDKLIALSNDNDSGFYLNNIAELHHKLIANEQKGKKTLLIGVTYALLDFAEQFPMPLKNTIIMETGGMKGRREELTRNEVHQQLCKAFDLQFIHSEYGMTELLSQAYSNGNGIFTCGSTMKVLLREEDDPLHIISNTDKPTRGVINIIDLANIYSCSFIATDDAGKLYPDGGFEVLGRIDNSDIRGCSLMLTN